MSNIFANINCKINTTRLKKTWRAAGFAHSLSKMEFLQSERSPSELAGPGSLLFYWVPIFPNVNLVVLELYFFNQKGYTVHASEQVNE